MSGNRVDNIYVAIGTDIADPAARLRAIHDGVRGLEGGPQRLGHGLLEQRADVVPPQLYQPTVRLWSRSHAANVLHPPLNVILSNVAGPKEPIRIGPVALDALYSVGPILEGIGCNITAWSYVDDLGVSVIGCPSSIPDPWILVDRLHDALGGPGRRRRPQRPRRALSPRRLRSADVGRPASVGPRRSARVGPG